MTAVLLVLLLFQGMMVTAGETELPGSFTETVLEVQTEVKEQAEIPPELPAETREQESVPEEQLQETGEQTEIFQEAAPETQITEETEKETLPETQEQNAEETDAQNAVQPQTQAVQEVQQKETEQPSEEQQETVKKDSEDEKSRGTEKETSAGDETERSREFRMKITVETGQILTAKEISGPEKLTSGGITHPVDYREGVYRVQAPEGIKRFRLEIRDLTGKKSVRLTKWGGYLTEQEKIWLLCPDDPIENAWSMDGEIYMADLEKFRIEKENMTLEQLEVYGTLKDDCEYAEIFICGSEVSAVLLIEIGGTGVGNESVTEPESETEPGSEAESGNISMPESEAVSESETEPESEAESGRMMESESETETELSTEIVTLEETETETAVFRAATPQEIKKTYQTVGQNLADSAVKYTPQVSSMNGEWQILGLARSNQAVDASVYSGYKENVLSTVLQCEGVLHKKKYTEYSRVVLALTALGEDVTNVGGYNLLQPLSDFDQTVWQGINGAVWALIAFDSHDYEIPAAEAGKTQNSREKLIRHILSKEISGGGWAMSGNKADPDVTGMAIQALAPYYGTDAEVKSAVDRAVDRLSALQNPDGGYSSWGQVNSESCSQVIVALTSLGIDPAKDSRFVKNGNSVVDALTGYSTTDGAFAHIKGLGADQMATEQGYYALTSYYRFLEGKTSLYDMSDVALKTDYERAAAAEALITALPENITLDHREQVQTALSRYNGLNNTQKSLISESEVEKLQNAVKRLEELGASMNHSAQETEAGSGTGTGGSAAGNSGTEAGSTGIGAGSTGTGTSGGGTNKNSGSNKVAGGTTKKVNLVSSGTKSGGTPVGSGSVSGAFGSSAGSKAAMEEKETETESETEGMPGEKKGGTKFSDAARTLISSLNSLFRSTKTGEKLPELAADYSDEQVSAILDIYRSFEGLTETDQKAVEESSRYGDYTEVLDKLKEENHYDESTGTDLRDNEEEVLPWYVQLQVIPKLTENTGAEAVKEALNGRGELFTLNDIQLTDLLNGGEYHPEDLIRVSIPGVDSREYENLAIVHVRDDGSMEFLEGHISGKYIEFDTDEFSMFGIVGFNGSLEDLMGTSVEEKLWVSLVPGGAAALLLLFMMALRFRDSGKRKKRTGDRN